MKILAWILLWLGSDCFTIGFSFCSGVEHVEEAKRIHKCALKPFLLITRAERCEIWLHTFLSAFNKIWSTVRIRFSSCHKSIESLSKLQWQQQQECHQWTIARHMLSFVWYLTRVQFLAFLWNKKQHEMTQGKDELNIIFELNCM